MAGDVQQGIAGISRHHTNLTDDVAAIGGQQEGRAPARNGAEQEQQHEPMQTVKRTHRRGWNRKGYFLHGQIVRSLGVRLVVLLALALAGPAASWAGGGQPWILVDTQALTLTVLAAKNHVLVRFRNIAIGSGGVADSHLRGDETTPRGVFHVSWIDRHSRFGTFYGLDYPTARIALRAYAEGSISGAEYDAIIRALRQHRTPPQDTPLGGQLGIHGIGRGDPDVQQAVNWTDGCIALNNRQILQLARWIHVGTRVVIR